MAYFHRIDFIDGRSVKINLDHVVKVKKSVTNEGRKVLVISYDSGESSFLGEGGEIEDVDREFNRFPC